MSSTTVYESFAAVGASFAFVTVSVTVAVLLFFAFVVLFFTLFMAVRIAMGVFRR